MHSEVIGAQASGDTTELAVPGGVDRFAYTTAFTRRTNRPTATVSPAWSISTVNAGRNVMRTTGCPVVGSQGTVGAR